MKTAREVRTRERRDARPRLSDFSRRLLDGWKRRGWPTGGGRVVVAVSGGADSTALLLALDELLKAGRMDLGVTAAHLDHGLRGEEGANDARWVEELARARGLEVVVGRADVRGRALSGRDNLEQAARRVRYEFLNDVSTEARAWAVLTAHTLDDQAETIMLRLLRGSGAEGLKGIRPERALVEGGAVKLLRPLVGWARRADTEGYCRARGVEFRTDEMNADERFARARVRRRLMPLLETFNPRAAEALARTAELLSDDADALDAAAARLLEEAAAAEPSAREKKSAGESSVGESSAEESSVEESSVEEPTEKSSAAGEGACALRVDVLASASRGLRRRALRLWIGRGRGDLRRVEMAHVLAVERLLEGVRGGRVAELPGGGRVERRRGRLRFWKKAEASGEGVGGKVVEKGDPGL